MPANMGSQLAVYEDTVPIMVLVGPRGWDCAAADGADGQGGMEVFPPSETTASGAPFAVFAEGVVGHETSACVGCELQQACELFSQASSQLQHQYPSSICPSPPAVQQTTQLSQTAVSFLDPAGVQGVGNPSGGANPAIGVLTFAPDSHNGSYMETCTLPAADGPLCQASIAVFAATYGNQ